MPTEQNVPNLKINLLTQSDYDGATINENELYLIKDQDVDFVVDNRFWAGSGWHARKWNSGKIELWNFYNIEEALSTQWPQNNNWFYGAPHQYGYPLELITVEGYQISVDGDCFIWYGGTGSTTQTPKFFLAYPISKASATYKVYIEVRGTWK